RAGEAELVVAGGMENMSRVPYASFDARWGARMGDQKLTDLMIHDGLWCAFENVHMAVHGDTVAKEYSLSREECDAFALRSQLLARDAMEAGRLADEITPVFIPQRKGDPVAFATDEQPRPNSSAEGLAALRPVFGTSM